MPSDTIDRNATSLAHTTLARVGIRVSTIWRQSSAALAPDVWYFETMAFKDQKILVHLPCSYFESDALRKHCGLVISLMREFGKEATDAEA